jgi:sulfotransferase
MTQFVCLSGLPRSGSTLLSAVLSQNPAIHSEGNSAVQQLMCDMYKSITINSVEQLAANRREMTERDLMISVPNIYYRHIRGADGGPPRIIVDKSRAWTLIWNVELARRYIDKNIKMIVLERPVKEVFKSFNKLYVRNGLSEEIRAERLNKMIEPQSDPIVTSLDGLRYARSHNQDNNFLFIQYADMLTDMKGVLDRIYEFCGWEKYEHDLTNINNLHQEDDEFYGLEGFHTVRKTISKDDEEFDFPKGFPLSNPIFL